MTMQEMPVFSYKWPFYKTELVRRMWHDGIVIQRNAHRFELNEWGNLRLKQLYKRKATRRNTIFEIVYLALPDMPAQFYVKMEGRKFGEGPTVVPLNEVELPFTSEDVFNEIRSLVNESCVPRMVMAMLTLIPKNETRLLEQAIAYVHGYVSRHPDATPSDKSAMDALLG